MSDTAAVMRIADGAANHACQEVLSKAAPTTGAGAPRSAACVAASKWLFGQALPFWSRQGVDRVYGGFVEELRLDGSNPNVAFKRIRVQARQIYVFSHAHVLGVAGAGDIAEHGYDFLQRHAWLGADGGWARQVTLEGRPLDRTPDLYDLAFVLFSLGWFYRATGRPDALNWCRATADFIETHMRHPSGCGFHAVKPAAGQLAPGPRLQNPHMHLLEGALSAYEATGEAPYRRLADEIVALFRDRLFDEKTGTLPEQFDDDLRPLAGKEGRVVEPGHQFEWAWLLAWYQRLTGRDMRSHARALVGFAERYGVDHRTGAVLDAVRNDGLVLNRGERIWPAAERLQAAVAMFEIDRQTPLAVFEQSGGRLLEKHLAHAPAGTWIDHFTVDGLPQVGGVPASTLYHLMIAFSEVLRIEDIAVRAAMA